jgi:hypothetical protein
MDFAAVHGVRLTRGDVVSNDGATSEGATRVASAVVVAISEGEGYVTMAIEGFDPSFDAAVDAVVLDGRLLVVGQQSLYEIDVDSASANPMMTYGLGPDAREAVVGDFNRDGLDDLMFFDGENGWLLAQLPVNP